MTIFKLLLSQNMLNENERKNNKFIDLTLQKIESLKLKFITADFRYKDVSILFEEENRDIYLKRLCLLFLIQEEDIQNQNIIK